MGKYYLKYLFDHPIARVNNQYFYYIKFNDRFYKLKHRIYGANKNLFMAPLVRHFYYIYSTTLNFKQSQNGVKIDFSFVLYNFK